MNFFEIKAQLNNILKNKRSKDAATQNLNVSLIQKLQSEVPAEILPQVSALIEKNYSLQSTPHLDKILEKHFDVSVYKELLCYTQIAHYFEPNGIPEEQALKLTLLFKDTTSALKYVEAMQTSLHDACLFQLPPITHKFHIWQNKAKRYMTDPAFRKFLPQAAELEQLMASKKGLKPNMHLIEKKKEEISTVHHKWKKLNRNHGRLNDAEKSEYQLLSLDLLNLNDELVELCWNISLENADIQILKAFHDYYVKSTTPAFQYFLKNGLTKKNYDKFLLLDRDNAGENIPEITIEGAEIKHPGFYLKKVCAKNDQEAARAACLGKLTDCCQSLSGEAGEPCVIHGLTNPDGGFYVLCQGDSENPSISDDVIGQCWVWRSKNGALVFDSIEMPKDKLMMYKNIVVDFYQSLGKKLVQEGYTHKVNCGKNSGISADVGFATLEYNKEEFIDYQGYCDSRVQFSIFDEDFPYPHYVKDSVITQKIDEDLEKAMRSNMPLVQVKEFANALNWAFVEKYNRNMNTNADAIIDKIQELSIQYNKQEEVAELISIMDKFVKRSFDFDELILLIKENKVHIDTFDGVNKTLLMLAANLGNDAIVQELIKFGAKIDLRNNECHTALMQATQGNCSNENEYSLISASPKSSINNVCKILIAQGADVNTKDQYGDSVLMHACHKGLGDHVDLLLAHGADVNYENNNNTSLIFAARGGFDQIILKLLDKGANMHHKNALGCTALSEAAANGFEGTVNILKQRGADINSQDNDGNTPLLRSIEGGYKCVINTLLTSNADVHIKNNSGDTVLMASIRQRINETLIEQILEKKPDLDAKARNNNTALGYAIDTKNEKLALTLIALGACPNVKHNGYPLLVKAIKNNLNCVIEKLIGKVDLNAKVIIDNVYLNNSRSNDDNALLSAVASKNILLVEKLVKFGADINAVGYLGRSALMDAIASYNTEMALFLISLGSNLEVKDKNGRTALDYAARYGDENVKDKINEINAQSEEKRNLLKIRMR